MPEQWIKVRHNLGTDPKVLQMSQDLGVEVDLVVGKLVRLWSWLDIVRQSDSEPKVYHREQIDVHIIAFTGFSRALYRVGWLTCVLPETASSREDGPYLVPNPTKWLRSKGLNKTIHRNYMRKWRAGRKNSKVCEKPSSEKAESVSQPFTVPSYSNITLNKEEEVHKEKAGLSKRAKKKEVTAEAKRNERRTRDWSAAVMAMKLDGPLHTAEFQSTWEEWSDYRSLEKKSPLGPRAIPKQIKMLEPLGVKAAIQTIERSIQNSWLGLFPEKRTGFDDWRDTGSRVRPKGEYDDNE